MIESNERYVPPTIKTVEISTRTCILQGSVVNNFQQGSGNTAEVDGHTVTFNCPAGLKYNLHLEREASGSTVTNVIFEDGSNPAKTKFWECGITSITSKSATPPDLCLDSTNPTYNLYS